MRRQPPQPPKRMSKSHILFFCCLLVLASGLALTPGAIPGASAQTSLDTVASRQQALSALLVERQQLSPEDKAGIVRVTNQIVELNLQLYDFDTALTNSAQSLELARQLERSANGPLIVDTMALTALVHIRRQENEPALTLLNNSLALSKELGYRRGEAQSRLHRAAAYYDLSEYSLAEQNINEAVPIWQEIQDKRGEALALTAQGRVFMLQDKPEQAIASLKLSESIWRSLGASIELATTLLDQSFLNVRLGQWQSALAALDEAQGLVIDPEAEPFLSGQIAMSFGEAYEAYGQMQIALTYFRKALQHYERARNRSATIDARNKIGRVLAVLGYFVEAKQTVEEGIRLAEAIKSRLISGLSHEDLGRIYLTASLHEQARIEFLVAIAHFEAAKTQRPLARAQSYLGQTEFLLGNLPAADQAYQTALTFFRAKSDYTNEAALSFGIGKLQLHQGRLESAGVYLRRSIDLTEQLRENASSKDLRSSFLSSVHDRYETYVELLMALHAREPNQHLDVRAFEASEFGHARALLDSIRNYQKELTQVDPLLLLQEEKLLKREQELIDARAEAVSTNHSEDAKTIESELTDVRARYESLQARINSSAKLINLLRPQPLSYETIKNQITNADTSLLTYSLGSKDSFAWVVTSDGLKSYKLAGKSTIERAVNQLLDLLKTPSINPDEERRLQTAIDEVSRLVLEPLSDRLKTSRLIVVADGVLQYVPFQALKKFPSSAEPLVSQFDIIQAPSASTLALVVQERTKRPPATKLLVGFGDAVFSPDSQSNSIPTSTAAVIGARSDEGTTPKKLPRLFHAKRELRAIGELVGAESEFYVEHAARRDNLLKTDLTQFKILHIVTHGIIDADQPELSGLMLSLVDANDQPIHGFVGLADIYKMRAPVDLVVLSACHTAMGKEFRGEGLIGLTRGFMYAGASSVLASLWKVDDEATAELMKHFYTFLLQDGMTPPAALRAAQNKIRAQPRWSSPFFWAGFTFQGNYDLRIEAPKVAPRRNYGLLIAGTVLAVALLAVFYWYLRRRRGLSSTTAIRR